jgi:hypothetical protein
LDRSTAYARFSAECRELHALTLDLRAARRQMRRIGAGYELAFRVLLGLKLAAVLLLSGWLAGPRACLVLAAAAVGVALNVAGLLLARSWLRRDARLPAGHGPDPALLAEDHARIRRAEAEILALDGLLRRRRHARGLALIRLHALLHLITVLVAAAGPRALAAATRGGRASPCHPGFALGKRGLRLRF